MTRKPGLHKLDREKRAKGRLESAVKAHRSSVRAADARLARAIERAHGDLGHGAKDELVRLGVQMTS